MKSFDVEIPRALAVVLDAWASGSIPEQRAGEQLQLMLNLGREFDPPVDKPAE